MSSRVLLAALGLAAAPAMACAQSAATPVGELIVTASRLPTTAAQTPYSVSVIAQDGLAGRASLAEVLAEQAEIYVQAPGGRSGISSVFLRGADPNFTVVLFDGVPLNNPTNTRGGSVNVSELSPGVFDRAEIVTGSLSSLYGSGALAGVVNLVVPGGAAEHTLRASFGAGTEEDYSGFLRWRGPLAGGYGASLALSVDDAGDETESSSFKSSSLVGKIAPLGREDGGRILFRLARTEADSFPDASGGPLYATLRETEHRKSREGMIAVDQPVVVRDGFRLDLSASYLERRDETASPGVAPSAMDPQGVPAGEDDTRYRRGIIAAVGRFDGEGWNAALGLEAQKEKARSEGFLDFGFPVPSGFRGDRATYSAFAEVARTVAHLTFNAGGRVDRIDELGAKATARLGLRYDIEGTGAYLRAAVGTGFKAPSFYSLGNPFVGNLGLGPEKSSGGEIGLGWNGAGGDAVSITGFYTRYAGLIDFVPGPPPRLENRGVVISKGVSASAVKAFGDQLKASVHVQYAQTEDDETGEQLLNRPRWRTGASLTWTPVLQLTLTGRYAFVGDRDDYATPTGPMTLSSYQTLAFDAAWSVQPATTVRLVVENALDDDHEDAIGFPSPGRRARILLTHDF